MKNNHCHDNSEDTQRDNEQEIHLYNTHDERGILYCNMFTTLCYVARLYIHLYSPKKAANTIEIIIK